MTSACRYGFRFRAGEPVFVAIAEAPVAFIAAATTAIYREALIDPAAAAQRAVARDRASLADTSPQVAYEFHRIAAEILDPGGAAPLAPIAAPADEFAVDVVADIRTRLGWMAADIAALAGCRSDDEAVLCIAGCVRKNIADIERLLAGDAGGRR